MKIWMNLDGNERGWEHDFNILCPSTVIKIKLAQWLGFLMPIHRRTDYYSGGEFILRQFSKYVKSLW